MAATHAGASVCTRMVAVREPDSADSARRVNEYLAKLQDCQVTRFPTCQDDRLDAQVREGRFERVVFANLDALLTPVWKGYLDMEAWLRSGVRIEVVDAPMPADQIPALLGQVCASYAHHSRKHRRRQTTAAVVLGVLSLGAMASLIWLVPRS